MSAGRCILDSIVLNSDMKGLLSLSIGVDFFGAGEQPYHDFVLSHVRQYGGTPAVNTVETRFGITVTKADEPLLYYVDILKKRYLQQKLRAVVVDASDLLKDKNPVEALLTIKDGVLPLVQVQSGNAIMDFRDSKKIIKDIYRDKLLEGDDFGLKFNWEYMDKFGSLEAGDMFSIVARPGMGKTFLLLYIALLAWQKQGKSIMFVTTEMKPQLIIQRLAAMHTNHRLTYLKNAELSTLAYNDMMNTLAKAKDSEAPFYVVDTTMASTVEDIWLLAQQMNPDAIFIDGAYLLQHPNKMLNKFTRIAENAELIKSTLATHLGIPVGCTYQLNREATKIKKGETPDMAQVAGSDAIPQLSSVMLALLQEDSLETMNRREITLMKGRSGEQGGFDINWDFVNMDFSQWEEPLNTSLLYMGA